jgi:hypothetical protein
MGLLHNLRQDTAEKPPLAVESGGASDVFGYMSVPPNPSLLPTRVAIGVSSTGNFFMTEIAHMLADAFRRSGAETRIFAAQDASHMTIYDAVIVVAPHEFFSLGDGLKAFRALRRLPNLIMFNTEQCQTQWFQLAKQYLHAAAAILDISYETARYLTREGYNAFALPLGYSEYIEQTFTSETIPEHELFKYMSPSIKGSLPADYAARPIDILFVGTASSRREHFFARHAGYFAGKQAFIYMPDGNSPFLYSESRTIDFAAFVALVKRSKILLNIHRDEVPFLEWQRIVTLGILQKTLVITDHCEPGICIEPGIDYLDGSLDSLPQLCESALTDPRAAGSLATQAYQKLKDKYSLTDIVQRWWTAYAGTNGN